MCGSLISSYLCVTIRISLASIWTSGAARKRLRCRCLELCISRLKCPWARHRLPRTAEGDKNKERRVFPAHIWRMVVCVVCLLLGYVGHVFFLLCAPLTCLVMEPNSFSAAFPGSVLTGVEESQQVARFLKTKRITEPWICMFFVFFSWLLLQLLTVKAHFTNKAAVRSHFHYDWWDKINK